MSEFNYQLMKNVVLHAERGEATALQMFIS